MTIPSSSRKPPSARPKSDGGSAVGSSIEHSTPSLVTIGVTGHRDIEAGPALHQGVHRALTELLRQLTPAGGAVAPLAVLSPLAEGADRIVASMALDQWHARLDAVLPLPQQEYEADFAAESSRREFAALLRRAADVKVLPPCRSRTEAYVRVGRYVVDHCDALIAVWDGLPAEGPGGTAEVVRYAQARRRPILWIKPSTPPQLAADWTGDGFAPVPDAIT